MYPCPNCGAEMKFDPSRQTLYCEHCGKTMDPQSSDPDSIKAAEESTPNFDGAGISPEEAMAVHQAAYSETEEITPARRRYEAYLAKKAGRPQAEESATPAARSPHPEKSSQPKETDNMQKPAPSKEIAGTQKPSRSTYTARVFSCPSCGAELISTDETVATFCSYCGSSVLLESRIQDEACPDYVIPFQVTKEDCEHAYKKMLRRALFAPDEMKQDTQIERFRGIYMPYWIYSFEKDGSYSVSGRKSRRRGDYVYTKHYRLQSHMTAECKGLSYDASSKFADNLSGAIAPFDIHAREEFATGYLSGFYADRGDVYSSVYYSQASDLAGQYVAKEADKNRVYSKYSVSRSSMASAFRPKRSDAELGMFPVWFLGCRSHDGQRISYAVVNGQTGKIAADLPIDLKKYLIGSVILAVPLFLLLNLFLTLTPTKALIAAIVLALFSLFLSNHQLNRIYTRDLQLDDLGLQSVARKEKNSNNTTGSRMTKGKTTGSKARSTPKRTSSSGAGSAVLRILGMMAVMWISIPAMGLLFSLGIFRSGFSVMLMMVIWFVLMVAIIMNFTTRSTRSTRSLEKRTVYAAPMREKWNTLYKPLLAMVIALAILIWNPVADLYYYIGAAAAMGCVIWSFFDIIKEHNLLTTRKLPQLDKRGGDENA